MPYYLEPSDPGAFDGFKLQKPDLLYGLTHLCSRCKGHGGWNLRLNAYGAGIHFKAHCSNCNGWGYVRASQRDHVHEWDNNVSVGHCLHKHTCKTCGAARTVDSSD